MKTKYYRIIGQYGVYILTKAEMDKAINRENNGIRSSILLEKDYIN